MSWRLLILQVVFLLDAFIPARLGLALVLQGPPLLLQADHLVLGEAPQVAFSFRTDMDTSWSSEKRSSTLPLPPAAVAAAAAACGPGPAWLVGSCCAGLAALDGGGDAWWWWRGARAGPALREPLRGRGTRGVDVGDGGDGGGVRRGSRQSSATAGALGASL